MNITQAYVGVTIAFTDVDADLMKLLDISNEHLDALHAKGEKYINVYRLRSNNKLHWVVYRGYTGTEPLVTSTEEVKQFLFETGLCL